VTSAPRSGEHGIAAAALIPVDDVVRESRARVRPHHDPGDAVDRVRTDLEPDRHGHGALAVGHTPELRSVYEAVWNARFDAANFRKRARRGRLGDPDRPSRA
jgi:hypothetical protein